MLLCELIVESWSDKFDKMMHNIGITPDTTIIGALTKLINYNIINDVEISVDEGIPKDTIGTASMIFHDDGYKVLTLTVHPDLNEHTPIKKLPTFLHRLRHELAHAAQQNITTPEKFSSYIQPDDAPLSIKRALYFVQAAERGNIANDIGALLAFYDLDVLDMQTYFKTVVADVGGILRRSENNLTPQVLYGILQKRINQQIEKGLERMDIDEKSHDTLYSEYYSELVDRLMNLALIKLSKAYPRNFTTGTLTAKENVHIANVRLNALMRSLYKNYKKNKGYGYLTKKGDN